MTMEDGKCDVCHMHKPIGVASTSMPMSVAYCIDCARRHADPEIVFETFYMGHENDPVDPEMGDWLITFKDGKYITYREWVEWRKQFPPTKLPGDTYDNTI